ncbi:MAG: ribonuclease III [Ignavibacteria bacterium]|nr:ribonuclease III [Ignavibacteria bacterium]
MRSVREILRRWFTTSGTPDRYEGPGSPFTREKLARLQRLIGHSIVNEALFSHALLHRSFLQRTDPPGRSNERLEFLGDSILNLVVGEYLYHHSPHAPEGDLTKLRSRLVNRKALAAYAREICLAEFIFMSPSAAQATGKGSDTIIADTYEALIAAIYLDGGYKAARRFIERQVLAAMKNGSVVTEDENYKSMLLEFAQANGWGVPRYSVIREEGPDHDRTFTVEVMLNNSRRGVGKGKNKKEAEQSAACEALSALGSL